MRLGIVTPVVSLNPRAHGGWEEAAGLALLRDGRGAQQIDGQLGQGLRQV